MDRTKKAIHAVIKTAKTNLIMPTVRLNFIAFHEMLKVNLLATSGDISQTWTSPMYSKLYSNDTAVNPLGHPITKDEDSWIGSLINIGAVIGSIPAGLIADKIGRKNTLLGIAIPHILAYLIFAFANKIYLFYIGRLINGIALGVGYAVLPMYIAEITEDSNRASLSVTLNVFWTFGNFLPYAIGPYLSVKMFNLILAIIPCIFFITFLFTGYESPYYLVHIAKDEMAEEIIMKLRSCSKDAAFKETLKIKETFNRHDNGSLLDIFTNRGLRKAFIVTLLLILLQQLSGATPIAYYLQPIFQASGTNLSPDISSTICGACMFIFSFSATLVVKRLGTKIPLAISCFGDFTALFILGTYFYIRDETSLSTDRISWLPLGALICYIFFFNFAFGSVPWTVSSELFPNNVKAISSSAVACCCWTSCFFLTHYFNFLTDIAGRAGIFWIFSGSCLFTLIFDLIWVPETKGKSLIQIQDMLQK